MMKKVMIATIASGFVGAAALTAVPTSAEATFLCKREAAYEPGSFCARHMERKARMKAWWNSMWDGGLLHKDKRMFKKRHAWKEERRAPRQPRRPLK